MQLANLNVSNFTICLAAVWCLIALFNGKAFVMLTTLISYTLIQAFTTTDFAAFLVVSTLYFYFAQANITKISDFRQIFLAFGAVYFLGAVDQAVFFHANFDTGFDKIQPYLITIINAYALARLIDGGGKQDAGLIDYFTRHCMRWINGLSLLQTSPKDNPR